MLLKTLKYFFKLVDRRLEHHITVIIFFLIILFVSKISLKYKIIIFLLVCIIYRKTIYYMYNVIKTIEVYKTGKYENMYTITNNLLVNGMNLIENFKDISKQNSIIMCNYPYEVPEYLVQWLIPRKITVIVIEELGNMMKKLGADVILVKKGKNNFDNIRKEIKEKIKHNSLFFYFNDPNSRCYKYDLGKIKSGVIKIAQELKIPITPIVVDFIYNNFGAVYKQDFRIEVGKTELVKNYIIYIHNIKRYYKKIMNKFLLLK